jgi:hypothetical protein
LATSLQRRITRCNAVHTLQHLPARLQRHLTRLQHGATAACVRRAERPRARFARRPAATASHVPTTQLSPRLCTPQRVRAASPCSCGMPAPAPRCRVIRCRVIRP